MLFIFGFAFARARARERERERGGGGGGLGGPVRCKCKKYSGLTFLRTPARDLETGSRSVSQVIGSRSVSQLSRPDCKVLGGFGLNALSCHHQHVFDYGILLYFRQCRTLYQLTTYFCACKIYEKRALMAASVCNENSLYTFVGGTKLSQPWRSDRG